MLRSALILVALAACSSSKPSVPDDDDDAPDQPDAPAIPHADAPGAIDATPPPPDAMSIHDQCFAGIGDPAGGGPNYDQFHPVVGSHCAGTNHQDITGIEKVVFLGDSITEGTPPTLFWDYYRERLAAKLRMQFGAGIEVTECSAWGAR